MTVDLHTHVWQSAEQLGPQLSARLRERFAQMWDQIDASLSAHESAMSHVQTAVVLGYRSRYLGIDVPNQWIANYISSRSQRMIGFAGIDPMDDDWSERLDEAVSLKFAGIAISPANCDFHPSHTRAMLLYERCNKLGLPIMVDQGTNYTPGSRLAYSRPFLLDEAARSFPNLKIVIAHCGYPFVGETLSLIGKHRNVYTELGNLTTHPWQLYNVLLEAFQFEVIDGVLFGSDFPYNTPERAIETIYSLNRFTQATGLPTVPREKLRSIIERDSLVELGIRRQVPQSGPAAPAPSPSKSTTPTEEKSS